MRPQSQLVGWLVVAMTISCLIVLASGTLHSSKFDRFRINKHKLKSVKTMHYIVRDKAEASLKLRTVGVKNVHIEAFSSNEWVAKAMWTGDNYNQTGFVFLLKHLL